jgi:hypothetical protein
MSKERYSEIVTKNGQHFLVQEMHHGPKKYLSMTRNASNVLECEKEAVQEMPVNEL